MFGCRGSTSPVPPPTGPVQLSFVNSSNPPTNPWPQSIAVADFNGDGKLDLAVPVYSIFAPFSDVNILLGNGDGTFTAGPTFPLFGQNVNNAVVADFNGDGKPDLAISLPDANQIQIALDGDSTFNALPPISVDSVYILVTGDFNHDGKADLATVNFGPGTLTILLGNGDGTFTLAPTITTPTTGPAGVAVGPVWMAVADFNKDGIPDLAALNGPRFGQGAPGSVTILLGNGDGTFTAKGESIAAGNKPLSVTVGDLNGDGIPDLVLPDMNSGAPELGNVTVLLGNGDGTFTPTATTLQVGAVPYSAAIADLDGDGKDDLVVASAGSDDVSVFVGKGDGAFAAPMTPATGTTPNFVVVGDFNGDGIPDLATANNVSNTVTVLLTERSKPGK
jgi:hypothetical protein